MLARRRTLVATALVAVVLGITCVLSLALGSKAIGLSDLVEAIHSGGDLHVREVLAARVPRTLCGLVAGAALASSGAAIQTVTRNPLGDPGVLGLTSGAAAGIVTVTSIPGLAGLQLVGGAFAGAAVATVAVMVLGSFGRGTDATRLVLSGAVTTAVAVAYSQAVSLRHKAAFDALRYWSAGSLAVGDFLDWWPVVVIAVAGAGLFALGRGLDAVALGDEVAAGLGHHPARVRALTLTAVALMTAAATAITGPIVFVGLAAPHMARRLARGSARALIGLCCLIGPVLMLLADVIGRLVLRPAEVPVGVVTALLGAPLLLAVVRRSRGVL